MSLSGFIILEYLVLRQKGYTLLRKTKKEKKKKKRMNTSQYTSKIVVDWLIPKMKTDGTSEQVINWYSGKFEKGVESGPHPESYGFKNRKPKKLDLYGQA